MAFLLFLGMEGQLGQYYFHEYDTVGTAAAVSLTLQGLKGQRYKRSLPQQERMTQHTCFACLFVPLSVHLCVCPSIFLSLSLSLPTCHRIPLSTCPTLKGLKGQIQEIITTARMYDSAHLFCLSICSFICSSVCLPVCLSLSLSLPTCHRIP